MKRTKWFLIAGAVLCLTVVGCSPAEKAETTTSVESEPSATETMVEAGEQLEQTLGERLDAARTKLDELGTKIESASESTESTMSEMTSQAVTELDTAITDARAELSALADKSGEEMDDARAAAERTIEQIEQRVEELSSQIDGEPETSASSTED